MSLARFFGFPAESLKAKPEAPKAKPEEEATPVRKRAAGKNGDASDKKRARGARAAAEAAQEKGDVKPAGPDYDEEKEEATRKKIQEMEEASEAEKADIDAIIIGMTEHMENAPKPCSETSIKSYAMTTKMIFKRDGRSCSVMSTKDYHVLIKSTYENKKVHSLHAAAIAKFIAFYNDTAAQNGGAFQVAPRWLELAKAAQKIDENGLKLRNSSQAEQYGTRYVGISQLGPGKWVASFKGQRIGVFATEETAVQAIFCAQRGLSVHAVGTRPLNWKRTKRPAPASDGQEAQADALTMMSEKSALPFDDGSGDINMVARSVSVMDPVSLTRIETPVRGKQCRHLEVFDRATYIEFNEMKAKMCTRLSKLWNCPICGAITKPEGLVVVPAFVEVLATIQDDPDISQVDVMPDGRLAVQPGQNSGSNSGEGDDSSDDDMPFAQRDPAAAVAGAGAEDDADGVGNAPGVSSPSTTASEKDAGASGSESKSPCTSSPSAASDKDAGASGSESKGPCISSPSAASEKDSGAAGSDSKIPDVPELSKEARDQIAMKRQQALERRKKKDAAKA